jgi:hypothetical protein
MTRVFEMGSNLPDEPIGYRRQGVDFEVVEDGEVLTYVETDPDNQILLAELSSARSLHDFALALARHAPDDFVRELFVAACDDRKLIAIRATEVAVVAHVICPFESERKYSVWLGEPLLVSSEQASAADLTYSDPQLSASTSGLLSLGDDDQPTTHCLLPICTSEDNVAVIVLRIREDQAICASSILGFWRTVSTAAHLLQGLIGQIKQEARENESRLTSVYTQLMTMVQEVERLAEIRRVAVIDLYEEMVDVAIQHIRSNSIFDSPVSLRQLCELIIGTPFRSVVVALKDCSSLERCLVEAIEKQLRAGCVLYLVTSNPISARVLFDAVRKEGGFHEVPRMCISRVKPGFFDKIPEVVVFEYDNDIIGCGFEWKPEGRRPWRALSSAELDGFRKQAGSLILTGRRLDVPPPAKVLPR